jgi:hypothetical protein
MNTTALTFARIRVLAAAQDADDVDTVADLLPRQPQRPLQDWWDALVTELHAAADAWDGERCREVPWLCAAAHVTDLLDEVGLHVTLDTLSREVQ